MPAKGRQRIHVILRRPEIFGIAVLIGLSPVPALAAPETFTCRHVSGGDFVPTIALTIDMAAKTVETSPDVWFEPVPDTIEVTDKSVGWGFMRGSATFDRQTHKFDWDARAEWAYLDYIGQTPTEPEDQYRGTMQCEAASR